MKNVFEYTGWKKHNCGIDYGNPKMCSFPCSTCPENKHHLDGNDMVLAINKMQERRDFNEFVSFFRWKSNMNEPYKKGTTYYYDADYISFMIGDPANFFRLMEEAIKEGVIGDTQVK